MLKLTFIKSRYFHTCFTSCVYPIYELFLFREATQRKNFLTSYAPFLPIFYRVFKFMQRRVLFSRHNFKIFYSVIKFVTIYVVNDFRRFKLSAYMLFHNSSVFKNLFSPLSNSFVPVMVYVPSSNFPPHGEFGISMPIPSSVMFTAQPPTDGSIGTTNYFTKHEVSIPKITPCAKEIL